MPDTTYPVSVCDYDQLHHITSDNVNTTVVADVRIDRYSVLYSALDTYPSYPSTTSYQWEELYPAGSLKQQQLNRLSVNVSARHIAVYSYYRNIIALTEVKVKSPSE